MERCGGSSHFTVTVHILSRVTAEKNSVCTSEWIAESVNTISVVIRRVMVKLKKAGFINGGGKEIKISIIGETDAKRD